MTRHVVFVVVGTTLLALGIAVMLGCGSGCSMGTWHIHSSGRTVVDGVDLPHKATLKASSKDPLPRIALAYETASIVVEGDATVTGVEAEYEVREKTPGDTSLAIAGGAIDVRSASGSPLLVTSAHIRVPPGTPVRVSTSVGRVKVTGIRGVDEVDAKSDTGAVEFASLADVVKLAGEASVGGVSLEGATGVASISLKSNTGAVTARQVAGAKDVSLTSDVSGIRAESIDASESVHCETDTGAVTVSDVKTKDMHLQSDVGAVHATRCAVDSLYAHTDIGAVKLEACTYKTKDVGSDLGGVVERK